jgi:hypothetical protein
MAVLGVICGITNDNIMIFGLHYCMIECILVLFNCTPTLQFCVAISKKQLLLSRHDFYLLQANAKLRLYESKESP